MIKKSIIIALSALYLICTSAYAQGWKDGWRNSPLTSKTSNEWRHKPYTTKPSDSWRSSPFSARQSESNLRWNKGKWQNSPSYWRNNPYLKKPVSSDKWQNRWDKRKWRYNPLNWRYSELGYKNTIRNYESESVIQEVKEWVPSKVESETTAVPEEKKEYAKAQIETVADEAETVSEKAPHKSGHTGNYITVISGTQTYRLEQSVQKTVHMAQGGLIEIYSSKTENH